MFSVNASEARKSSDQRVLLRVASRSDSPKGNNNSNPKNKLVWLILSLLALFLVYYLIAGKRDKGSPIILDPDGNVVLAPHRQAKLDKELEEIDNAIQYVLLATANKYYPCYTCPDGIKTLFLSKGEVWRYGTVRSASLSIA